MWHFLWKHYLANTGLFTQGFIDWRLSFPLISFFSLSIGTQRSLCHHKSCICYKFPKDLFKNSHLKPRVVWWTINNSKAHVLSCDLRFKMRQRLIQDPYSESIYSSTRWQSDLTKRLFGDLYLLVILSCKYKYSTYVQCSQPHCIIFSMIQHVAFSEEIHVALTQTCSLCAIYDITWLLE